MKLLTRGGRDKMAPIFILLPNPIFKRLKNHCNLFLRVQLIINQNWFRQWLGTEKTLSHYLSQWWSRLMVHIWVSWIDWVDNFAVLGKYIYADKNGTVWAHEGYLHPHRWKWAIPTPRVGSGRGTGWPYFVKSPLACMTHSGVACAPPAPPPPLPSSTNCNSDSGPVGVGSSMHPCLVFRLPIGQTCSMGFMHGFRAGQFMTSVPCCARKAVLLRAVWGVSLSWEYTKFRPKRLLPREANYLGEAWCRVGGSGFHPAPPVHPSHHSGWHPISWLRGHGYRPWVGCMHLSVSLLVRRNDKTIVPGQSDQLSVFTGSGQTHPTFTPPPMCLGVAVASQNFADASLQHAQHSCYFSLGIALSWKSCNTHQHLLLPIPRHDAIKEWQKMQNDWARNTRSIEPSIC